MNVLLVFVWEMLFKILIDGRKKVLLCGEVRNCEKLLFCEVLNLCSGFLWKKDDGEWDEKRCWLVDVVEEDFVML